MSFAWPNIPNPVNVEISQRTTENCKICGCFSSEQTCWHCTTSKYIIIEEANKRANLIIGQQAEELKSMSDKIDALDPLGVKYATLQTKIRKYLALKSIDGVAERQTLRKELAELIK